MTLKRVLFRGAVRTLEGWYLSRPARGISHLTLNASGVDDDRMDIVTVAFNNAAIIPLHQKYIERYMLGNCTHIVADNSSNEDASKKIAQYCNEAGIAYIRLPKNPLGKIGPSYSHAGALNWVYRHVIKPRRPAFWGITDHDLFPVAPINLRDELRRQHIYGPLRQRGNFWYMSAILSFFDQRWLEDKKVDFMPVTYDGVYLDTGGGLWKEAYSTLDQGQIRFCTERMANIREGENRHQDKVEIFDEKWLHTINGSYWKKVAEKKEGILEDLVAKYEKEIGKPEER